MRDLEKELDLAVLKVMETDPVVAMRQRTFGCNKPRWGASDGVCGDHLLQDPGGASGHSDGLGENGIKSRVTAALERVEPAITLQVTNYQPVNLDLFVRTYYEDHLETIMECPQVVVQVYPEQGSERVVEIQFLYSASQETLLQMRQEVQVLLNSAAGYVEGQTSRKSRQAGCMRFSAPLFVQSRPSETPVYSLLCGHWGQPVGGYGLWTAVPPGWAGLPGGFRYQQWPGVVLEYYLPGWRVLSRGCADGFGGRDADHPIR